MTVRELIAEIRDVLQDTESVYFSDSELVNLYNECKRLMTLDRKEKKSSITIQPIDGIYSYTTEDVLVYLSAKDSDGNVRTIYEEDEDGSDEASGIVVMNENELWINTPDSTQTITLRVIASPEIDNLNDTIRVGDEIAYKNYILAKSYEKDTDLEQFQKAQYFIGQFSTAYMLTKKVTSSNNKQRTNNTVLHSF